MGIRPETEKSFMAAVVEYAKLRNWRCYHTFDSRKSEAGFPDVVFARGSRFKLRLVVAELKLAGKKPTESQWFFVDAFEYAGVPTYVWTPDDWPEIRRVLDSD